MTLTFEIRLGRVNRWTSLPNIQVKGHLVQKSLSRQVDKHTDAHIGSFALPGPLKWSVTLNSSVPWMTTAGFTWATTTTITATVCDIHWVSVIQQQQKQHDACNSLWPRCHTGDFIARFCCSALSRDKIAVCKHCNCACYRYDDNLASGLVSVRCTANQKV